MRHIDVTLKYKPGGHTDPGPMFNWDQFVKDINSMLTQYRQKTGEASK